MAVVLATTAGLSLWIVLWALGIKSFDAFMITTLIILVAGAGQILKGYLPGAATES
jgi:hypothetical protein